MAFISDSDNDGLDTVDEIVTERCVCRACSDQIGSMHTETASEQLVGVPAAGASAAAATRDDFESIQYRVE